MTTAAKKYRQKEVYSHDRSRQRRAEENVKGPTAMQTVRLNHHEEKNELGQKHRRESVDLERQIDNENAQNAARNIDRGSARHDRLRSDLKSRHDRERGALAKRHEREMESAMAKNPIE
jgi:hypothetical protein